MRPTPQQLRERIAYDPDTGSLTWLPYRNPSAWQIGWNARCAWRPAMAHISKRGYLNGSWKPYTLTAHRVAWAIHYGRWPEGQLDHINGDKTDNRIANLREVSNRINALNCKRSQNNTSGVTGVFWSKSCQKWVAQISVHGRGQHLGLFTKMADAVAARKAAERAHGFHENHGQARQE